ncbi:peptidoglycan DD-metalloendopeptidase family protein [Mumia sp. DW29H23]|uniref:peptidoglycan DD-metalloendopeptidase family protein n=1 Tax=Mumia sp. DW29H23 TaxID=3421241 RepID=UPI003D693103
MRRASVPLLASVLLVVSACASPSADDGATADPEPAPATATRSATATAAPTVTAAPPAAAAVDASVLALRATRPATARSCGPQDVALSLTPVEPALGHRYARVALRNVSGSACTVEGYPGVGGQGQSGDPLVLAAEQRQRTGESAGVTRIALGPAAEAFVNVEWGGSLGGAETERITALALQLARGQDPVVARTEESLDIGNGTTVRVGPWEAGPATARAAACKVGPRRTPSGIKRFWTTDRRCYTSRWFAGAHRRMIPYGCTRAPWYAPSSRCTGGKGFHHGLDLDMPKGTKVYAGVSGRIITRGIGTAYGSRAVIIRSRGRDILLGHLRSRAVQHGDRVRKGDLVGRSGARGAPDGPHLHLEVRPAGGSYRSAVSPRRVAGLTVAR